MAPCSPAKAGRDAVGQEQPGGDLFNPSLFWVVTLAPGGEEAPVLPPVQVWKGRTFWGLGLVFFTNPQLPAVGVIRLLPCLL